MLQRLLSFFFMLCLTLSSILGTNILSYEKKTLLNDPDFSDGFVVLKQTASGNAGVPAGEFTYKGAEGSPSWMIAQWNSGPCLWENALESDEYTVTDGMTKWVTYDPRENSVSLRLNASEVYKGEAAGDSSWPHLLLEQSPIADYHSLSDTEKAYYNLEDNRIVLELSIRMTDFKDTLNKDGINAVQFLAFFYLKDTSGDNFIWFGVDLFDSRGMNDTYRAKDTVSGNMIYTLSTRDTYGITSDGLFDNGKPRVSDEWVKIRVDLTPHLADCIKRANEDNIFGERVSLSDFYIGGTNIGFEIHGNYDCTMEIKDFDITSYTK